MKKIISILLCLSMFAIILVPSLAISEEEWLENHSKANDYHTKLVIYFSEKGEYPDNYGGAHLNQETGNLVINLTERSEAIEAEYYEICQAEKLEFRTVKYSLNQLFAATNEVKRRTDELEKTGKYTDGPIVTASAVRQTENIVWLFANYAYYGRITEEDLCPDTPDAIVLKFSIDEKAITQAVKSGADMIKSTAETLKK